MGGRGESNQISEPLLPPVSAHPSAPPPDGTDTTAKATQAAKYCLTGCGACFLVLFVLAWILQGCMYAWATSMAGCRGSSLEGYNFPGGEASKNHDAAYNAVPQISLLVEREAHFYGQGFDVIPSNAAAAVADAPVGVWWRTWGPIFWTYTYEDVLNSRTTIYMRQNLLHLGQSHRIARCDGKGPDITFTEGSNWLGNRIRALFGMNQGFSYKVYAGNDWVATAEETSHSFSSITFANHTTEEKIASALLKSHDFHGHKDEWLVNNQNSTDLPYFVAQAASVLFAFHEKGVADSRAEQPYNPNPPGGFLEASQGSLEAPAEERVRHAPSEVLAEPAASSTDSSDSSGGSLPSAALGAVVVAADGGGSASGSSVPSAVAVAAAFEGSVPAAGSLGALSTAPAELAGQKQQALQEEHV